MPSWGIPGNTNLPTIHNANRTDSPLPIEITLGTVRPASLDRPIEVGAARRPWTTTSPQLELAPYLHSSGVEWPTCGRGFAPRCSQTRQIFSSPVALGNCQQDGFTRASTEVFAQKRCFWRAAVGKQKGGVGESDHLIDPPSLLFETVSPPPSALLYSPGRTRKAHFSTDFLRIWERVAFPFPAFSPWTASPFVDLTPRECAPEERGSRVAGENSPLDERAGRRQAGPSERLLPATAARFLASGSLAALGAGAYIPVELARPPLANTLAPFTGRCCELCWGCSGWCGRPREQLAAHAGNSLFPGTRQHLRGAFLPCRRLGVTTNEEYDAFMSKVVFSNEATFHTNGKVNRHNGWIWGQ
ncbi:hypothetical protein PR048_017724 [Dryococelus australis]|uniref:Uncharacterized protein n=1 Tax=Dryococelus australis TaxID=614101 RepID=A0ABQ9HA98_9NEOP|nr:hypothetical protein PR048_017724 [Dryococelus australis]